VSYIDNFDNFIRDRVEDYEAVIGEKKLEEPSMIPFKNLREGLELAHKHLTGDRTKLITLHGDVDMDGVGCTYIMNRFTQETGGANRTRLMINKKKVHGVNEKHAEYFKNREGELLIILDSGSNDLEYIKRMGCDVLVIDHHNVLHEETTGSTAGGKYVIINNMIENKDYVWLVSELSKNGFRYRSKRNRTI